MRANLLTGMKWLICCLLIGCQPKSYPQITYSVFTTNSQIADKATKIQLAQYFKIQLAKDKAIWKNVEANECFRVAIDEELKSDFVSVILGTDSLENLVSREALKDNEFFGGTFGNILIEDGQVSRQITFAIFQPEKELRDVLDKLEVEISDNKELMPCDPLSVSEPEFARLLKSLKTTTGLPDSRPLPAFKMQ